MEERTMLVVDERDYHQPVQHLSFHGIQPKEGAQFFLSVHDSPTQALCFAFALKLRRHETRYSLVYERHCRFDTAVLPRRLPRGFAIAVSAFFSIGHFSKETTHTVFLKCLAAVLSAKAILKVRSDGPNLVVFEIWYGETLISRGSMALGGVEDLLTYLPENAPAS